MDELVKAVVARYLASAGDSLRAVTGAKLWLNTAPQDVSGTYLVFSVDSNSEDWVMGPNRNVVMDFTITFRICSDSSMATCMTALPLLEALYDDHMFSMTTCRMMLMQRTAEYPTRDFDSGGYLIYIGYHAILAK